jgi:thiol-disulfide isomerase/thioredoxin
MRRLVLALAFGLAALISAHSAPARAQEAARPWIGISIAAAASGHGVLVKEVIENTPAARAGLRAGDEVESVDGKAVAAPADLIERIQQKGVGEKVTLALRRAGKAESCTLALEARPGEVELLRGRLLGKPAPTFALNESQGTFPARSAELSGKVVVVEFWATWCGPCQSTIPRLTAWQERWGGKGLRVVGISTEDWDLLSAHARKAKMGYTVARDGDGMVTSRYAVPAIPTLVVIDQQGLVRYVDVGAGEKLDAAEHMITALLEGHAGAP